MAHNSTFFQDQGFRAGLNLIIEAIEGFELEEAKDIARMLLKRLANPKDNIHSKVWLPLKGRDRRYRLHIGEMYIVYTNHAQVFLCTYKGHTKGYDRFVIGKEEKEVGGITHFCFLPDILIKEY